MRTKETTFEKIFYALLSILILTCVVFVAAHSDNDFVKADDSDLKSLYFKAAKIDKSAAEDCADMDYEGASVSEVRQCFLRILK